MPSWLVFIGFMIFYIAPEIRNSELGRFWLPGLQGIFFVRIILSYYFLTAEKSKTVEWFYSFEWITTVFPYF